MVNDMQSRGQPAVIAGRWVCISLTNFDGSGAAVFRVVLTTPRTSLATYMRALLPS